MKYRAEIDGLRALAVLPVIFFHAGFEWFSGGFVGVDVFLVISGYLITTLIVSEISEGKFSLVNFYERRARRILPGLLFVMAVSLPFAMFLLKPLELKNFGQSLFATSTFASNVLFWVESGYFEPAAELKPLIHTWSLALEEQYYLLFPIFMIATWQLGNKWILSFLSLIFLSSLGLAEWAANQTDQPELISAAYYLLPTRVWELLIGVFVALWLRNNHFFESIILNQIMSVIGVLMIAGSILFFDANTPFPSLYTLVPVIGTALLILCCVKNTPVYDLLTMKPLVGLGLISYSAYLWHQPVLAFARHLVSEDLSSFVALLLCTFSLMMAWLSWRFIERPYRGSKNFGRRSVFLQASLAMSVFSVLGLYIHLSNGIFYTHPKNLEIKNSYEDVNYFFEYLKSDFDPCEKEEYLDGVDMFAGINRCFTSRSGKPKVAVFGDSHAEHLYIGYEEATLNPSVYLIRGERPFYGEVRVRHLMEGINSDSNLGMVVYSALWDKIYRDMGEEEFERSLAETLTQFSDAGKSIVVLLDVPYFPMHSRDCYYTSVVGSGHQCEIGSANFASQRGYVQSIRRITNSRNIKLLDPAKYFCDSHVCSMVVDGHLLYRDAHHLNVLGSKYVGSRIAEELRQSNISESTR